MKHIKTYEVMASFKTASDYLKDIFLEMEDNGIFVKVNYNDNFNRIDICVDNHGDSIDLSKYLDVLGSADAYLISVGLYMSEIRILSNPYKDEDFSRHFDNGIKTYKRFYDLERDVNKVDFPINITEIEIYIYRWDT